MRGRGSAVVATILALTLSLALTACGGTSAKPNTATGKAASTAASSTATAAAGPAASSTKPAGSGAALTKVSVMMAYLATGWDAGFWVAQDKGFYKQQGLDVTAEPGKATFQTVQQVANGNITFGQLDGGTLITADSRGLPLIGVAQLFKAQPFAVMVPASSKIQSIADLKGKRLGDNPSNATAQLLTGVLADHHMTKADLHLVDMDNHTLPVALLQHKVDAIAGLSIGQGALIEFKGMPLRFLMYGDNGVDQPGFAIATSASYARAHPDVVRRFILGTREGMTWSRQHAAQAEAILHQKEPHTNLKLLKKQLQLSLPFWSSPPGGAFDLNQYKTAEAELLKFGVIKKSVPVSQLVTNQYVPK